MIRNSSTEGAGLAELAGQETEPVRRARKRGRKGLIAAILVSAAILLGVLSSLFLIKSENILLSPDDAYTVVRMPGIHLLFYGAAGGGPEFRFIDAGSGSPPEISALTSCHRKYAVLISAQGIKIYDHGKQVSGYENQNQMETISSCAADYDGDGNEDLFLLLKRHGQEYGERLIILSYNGLKTQKTYDESFQKVNPWKVQVCDVDGDGKPEVSLGVYTVAKYHPVYAKRPFLYEFSNHQLYPKWLGSRLSRPFDDYVFCDVDGDGKDELIASEATRDDKKELDAYQWTGFGFESIGVSPAYDTMSSLTASHGSVTAVCGTQTASAPKTFTYRNEKLATGG
jgi:hypothetical protein